MCMISSGGKTGDAPVEVVPQVQIFVLQKKRFRHMLTIFRVVLSRKAISSF